MAADFAGRRVWFEGHWGFQYYAQQAELRPLDFLHPTLEQGDLIIEPENNTNRIPLPETGVTLVGEREFPGVSFLSTMDQQVGAGFYADVWGPLPYAFGAVRPDRYRIFQVLHAIRY